MLDAPCLRYFTCRVGETKCLTSQQRGRDVDAFIGAYGHDFDKAGEEVVIKNRFCRAIRKVSGNAIDLAPQFRPDTFYISAR